MVTEALAGEGDAITTIVVVVVSVSIDGAPGCHVFARLQPLTGTEHHCCG